MDWIETYQPLIGSKIEAVIWMPMTSDTPQLTSELKSSSFSYTGAAFIAFNDDKKLFLSWKQYGDNMALCEGIGNAWTAYSLDRLRSYCDDTWGEIDDAKLNSVEFYTVPSIDGGQIVGIRHRISAGSKQTFFWIGTGGADFIGDMDDLWVGVGVDPPNFEDLIPMGTLG